MKHRPDKCRSWAVAWARSRWGLYATDAAIVVAVVAWMGTRSMASAAVPPVPLDGLTPEQIAAYVAAMQGAGIGSDVSIIVLAGAAVGIWSLHSLRATVDRGITVASEAVKVLSVAAANGITIRVSHSGIRAESDGPAA